MKNPLVGLLNPSVASIMGDFSKKITALKSVQVKQNQAVTQRSQQIKTLKAENFISQAEISAAEKAITALSSFEV